MVSFPGFFGDSSYDEEDPTNLQTPNPFSTGMPSFLPGAAQDLTTAAQSAPDFNIGAPAEQPPAFPKSFLPQGIRTAVDNAANANGVPIPMAEATVQQESSGNPFADNPAPGTSRGLFGMTDAATTDANKYMTQHMWPLPNPDRTDPLGESLRGTAYQRMMLDKTGNDVNQAAYHFNAGPGVADSPDPSQSPYVKSLLAKAGGSLEDVASPTMFADNSIPGATATDVGGNAPASSSTPEVESKGAITPAIAGLRTTSSNIGDTSPGDGREDTIKKLMGQSSDYEAKALQARKDSLAPDSVGKGQMFANVGVPLLAAIIGGALRGKKGAMLGAGAGFAGDAAGMATQAAEDANKDKIRSQMADKYEKQSEKTQGQAEELRKQGFAAADAKALEDKRVQGGQAERLATQRMMQEERLKQQAILSRERMASTQHQAAQAAQEKQQQQAEKIASISQPIMVQDNIIVPATPLNNKVRESEKTTVDKLAARYDKALSNLQRMKDISEGNTTWLRSFGDSGDALAKLRNDTKEMLLGINTIGTTRGAGSKWNDQEIDKNLPSPDHILSNLAGTFMPGHPSISSQLSNMIKIVKDDMKASMKGFGFNSYKIGDVLKGPDGSSGKVTGVAPDGSLILERQ